MSFSINQKWDHNIDLAKKLLSQKKYSQMQVADLALEVCEITWGGSSKSMKMKTLTEFAKEIGVNAKTLSNWVGIKKNIYDKLTPDLKINSKMTHLIMAAKSVSTKCSVKEAVDAVSRIVYTSGPDMRLIKYLANLKSIHTNMQNEGLVLLCKEKTLAEIKYYCHETIKTIDKNAGKKIVAADHGLCSAKTHFVSAASTMGVSRVWKMNESDKAVLDFMTKKKSLSHGVVNIGRNVFKEPGITPTAAKLRTIRSLNKLREMGLVSRDEFNQYQLKYDRKV